MSDEKEQGHVEHGSSLSSKGQEKQDRRDALIEQVTIDDHLVTKMQNKPLPGPTTRKRSDGERELDLIFIAKMYVRGFTQREIAAELAANRTYSLAPNTIGRDIGEIRTRWRESYLVDVDDAMAKELARLDELEKAYWYAWEDSRKTRKVSETEKIDDEQGSGSRATKYTRRRARIKEMERDGDPKFLEGIQWCIQQRCKILGLEASKKIEVEWREEARRAGIDPAKFQDDLVGQFMQAAAQGKETSGG
jgi:hypothetical protein